MKNLELAAEAIHRYMKTRPVTADGHDITFQFDDIGDWTIYAATPRAFNSSTSVEMIKAMLVAGRDITELLWELREHKLSAALPLF